MLIKILRLVVPWELWSVTAYHTPGDFYHLRQSVQIETIEEMEYFRGHHVLL